MILKVIETGSNMSINIRDITPEEAYKYEKALFHNKAMSEYIKCAKECMSKFLEVQNVSSGEQQAAYREELRKDAVAMAKWLVHEYDFSEKNYG